METPFLFIAVLFGIVALYQYGVRMSIQDKLKNLEEDLDQYANSISNAEKNGTLSGHCFKDSRLRATYSRYVEMFLDRKLKKDIEAMKNRK